MEKYADVIRDTLMKQQSVFPLPPEEGRLLCDGFQSLFTQWPTGSKLQEKEFNLLKADLVWRLDCFFKRRRMYGKTQASKQVFEQIGQLVSYMTDALIANEQDSSMHQLFRFHHERSIERLRQFANNALNPRLKEPLSDEQLRQIQNYEWIDFYRRLRSRHRRTHKLNLQMPKLRELIIKQIYAKLVGQILAATTPDYSEELIKSMMELNEQNAAEQRESEGQRDSEQQNWTPTKALLIPSLEALDRLGFVAYTIYILDIMLTGFIPLY